MSCLGCHTTAKYGVCTDHECGGGEAEPSSSSSSKNCGVLPGDVKLFGSGSPPLLGGACPTAETSVGGSRENVTADARDECDTWRTGGAFEVASFVADSWREPSLTTRNSDEVSSNDPNYREVPNTSVPAGSNSEGVYRGQVDMETGLFNGQGTFTSPETTVTGQWQNGQLHGFARQTWQDGRTYEGHFRDGVFHGQGRMTWQHPRGKMVYEGQYLDDKKHGEGKFTWPSGRSYEGQWVAGKREGIGVDTSCSGTRIRGVWEDNVFLRAVNE